MWCPKYRVTLVREKSIRYAKASSSAASARICRELLADEPAEVFVVLTLSTKLDVIGVTTVSRGTLDATLVHPREVFQPALLQNASAIIVAHNHPSGDTKPSKQDYAAFERLKRAGDTLGIDVLDSLVVGDSVYSMSSDCHV